MKTILTTETLKAEARHLRQTLDAQKTPISHGQALEAVARLHGYRDWNTASASLPKTQAKPNSLSPQTLSIGDAVEGRYLGHAFSGRVVAMQQWGGPDHWRLTIDFDEAVDVVRFESFSAFRKRVTAVVDRQGISPAQTSDRCPHLVLHP